MSFYDAVVPAYLQILNSLTGELTKAEAHCEAKKIAPEVLLGSRLYADMLPLTKQVQLVCDHAARGCARLTHSVVLATAGAGCAEAGVVVWAASEVGTLLESLVGSGMSIGFGGAVRGV